MRSDYDVGYVVKLFETKIVKLTIQPKQPAWWFWAITLVCIVAALAGWDDGYDLVMLISAVQVFYFTIREKSLFAFDTQVRLVYFAYTLFGFWESARFYFFLPLLLGTFMVTFFDKCSIALVLKKMPWNKT